MADLNGPIDTQSVTDVPIDPESNNPIEVNQTSIVSTTDTGGVPRDNFQLAVNLTGANVAEHVNVSIVIDQSGSTRNDSGTDFTGDGNTDSILTAELFAALELFDAYVAAGYDPDEITISLVTYTNDAEVRGSFGLDERDAFMDSLDTIRVEGPQFTTNYVAGLDAAGDSFTNAGASPDDTNIVVFLSDGFPVPGGQDIAGAASDLEDDWGALITGVGLGENSSLDALNELDNTGGATQVLSGDELLDIVVEPLTDADFLRFEILIEGVDDAGNPLTQRLVFEEGDPEVITTQLGWSIDCIDIDPNFAPGQDVTITVNGIFAEDPGNPGSGEQVVTTQHELPIVVCFTPGVRILTPGGAVAVEELEVGDRVVTRDHGVQQIAWIGQTIVSAGRLAASPTLRPILIRKDALGPGQPEQDMRVSRQHRMLVRDWRSEMLFGEEGGVLVPAFALCNGSTVVQDLPEGDVTYIHIAFESHEIVYADGVETESFHPADRTVSGLSSEQRGELLTLFPHLAEDEEFAYRIARDQIRGREGHLFRG
ncbi:Hint domain-containing protein [Primorskyibacter sp. S87]|uniref:Hint domain-containing protein n=1 Tax=Primorskyibacter sp. S87 TaxID=3415126 RepID=UPI003C79FA1B